MCKNTNFKKLFFKIENKSAYEILGDPDYLKMKSCMTLFKSVQTESEIFSIRHRFTNGL